MLTADRIPPSIKSRGLHHPECEQNKYFQLILASEEIETNVDVTSQSEWAI